MNLHHRVQVLQASSAHLWKQKVSHSQREKCGLLVVLSSLRAGRSEEHACLLCIEAMNRSKKINTPPPPSNPPPNLLSAYPASRWRVRSVFPDAKTKNKIVWTRGMYLIIKWHWGPFFASHSFSWCIFSGQNLLEIVVNLDILRSRVFVQLLKCRHPLLQL